MHNDDTVEGVPMEDARVYSSEAEMIDFFNNLDEILQVGQIPRAVFMNIDDAGFNQYADLRRSLLCR